MRPSLIVPSLVPSVVHAVSLCLSMMKNTTRPLTTLKVSGLEPTEPAVMSLIFDVRTSESQQITHHYMTRGLTRKNSVDATGLFPLFPAEEDVDEDWPKITFLTAPPSMRRCLRPRSKSY